MARFPRGTDVAAGQRAVRRCSPRCARPSCGQPVFAAGALRSRSPGGRSPVPRVTMTTLESRGPTALTPLRIPRAVFASLLLYCQAETPTIASQVCTIQCRGIVEFPAGAKGFCRYRAWVTPEWPCQRPRRSTVSIAAFHRIRHPCCARRRTWPDRLRLGRGCRGVLEIVPRLGNPREFDARATNIGGQDRHANTHQAVRCISALDYSVMTSSLQVFSYMSAVPAPDKSSHILPGGCRGISIVCRFGQPWKVRCAFQPDLASVSLERLTYTRPTCARSIPASE